MRSGECGECWHTCTSMCMHAHVCTRACTHTRTHAPDHYPAVTSGDHAARRGKTGKMKPCNEAERPGWAPGLCAQGAARGEDFKGEIEANHSPDADPFQERGSLPSRCPCLGPPSSARLCRLTGFRPLGAGSNISLVSRTLRWADRVLAPEVPGTPERRLRAPAGRNTKGEPSRKAFCPGRAHRSCLSLCSERSAGRVGGSRATGLSALVSGGPFSLCLHRPTSFRSLPSVASSGALPDPPSPGPPLPLPYVKMLKNYLHN